MTSRSWAGVALLAFVTVVAGGMWRAAGAQARQSSAREVPQFEVDPSWPKLPNKSVLGLVSGVNVDAQDHVWVLHRPRTVRPEQKAMAAPAVLEFDAAGNFIQAWGGPGEGYEWPNTEHGISVDSRGFVWIAGSSVGKDSQVLKFTKDGKFVRQIGRAGQTKGNTDTANANGAADVTLYAKTNEIFVADGYGNRRVIVFDADTGAFKQMWGAFGNVPADPKPGESVFSSDDEESEGPQQFNGVRSARVSNDDLVYVCDRDNQRVQVFTLAGKYVAQVFVNRGKMPLSTATAMAWFGKEPLKDVEDAILKGPSTASRTAFSPDPQQRFLYVLDRRHQRILILDRKTLETSAHSGAGWARPQASSTCSTTWPPIQRATSTRLKSTETGIGGRKNSCSREWRRRRRQGEGNGHGTQKTIGSLSSSSAAERDGTGSERSGCPERVASGVEGDGR